MMEIFVKRKGRRIEAPDLEIIILETD